MAIRPLKNGFLFAFFNDTSRGMFTERNHGKILITTKNVETQATYARWGKVLATGPQVTDFKVGDIVLIEAGKWTLGFMFEGVKIWKSDQDKVIALGEDESVTYSY